MISIVIPNYNGNKYLQTCLNSVYKEKKIQIELIIIDNASIDNDYNWVKEQYPNSIFKQLNENYGFSRAVNEGIKLAQGEYVLLLNNDTEIQKDFIESLLACIESDPKIFSVCSQMIQYHNPTLIDDAGDEYTVLGWAYKRGDGKPIDTYKQVQSIFSSCAGAALYRKAVFEKIGYFDENFFAYMEDVDISYRALIYGYKNMYCPEAKVLHIGSATSGSKYNAFKVKLAARNNVYVPYKNMPFLQFLINLPFLILGHFIKYLFFLKKGFGKEYVEGFKEGIKTLKKVKKVPFRWTHLFNYIYIEWLLVRNTFSYVYTKIFKK
nr:glycosyltransferase family 2 protein [uncultured Niameybacter sp.]